MNNIYEEKCEILEDTSVDISDVIEKLDIFNYII